MKCYGCGAEKDPAGKEVYPYPEDQTLCDGPIQPLFVIECQSIARDEATGFHDFRAVVVCHECFRKLDPDMWIGEQCWRSLNPKVPFDLLPKPHEEKWEPTSYPDLVLCNQANS